jgi:hypothetical protein
MSGGFPSHKNTFQAMHANIWTSPRQEKTPIGLGQHLPATKGRKQKRERGVLLLLLLLLLLYVSV